MSIRTKRTLELQTRDHALNAVKSVLNRAIEWEYITRNPAAYVQRATLEEAEGEINALSPAEVRDLLDNASEDLRPMYATAVYTGLRRGELSGLQWRDLDLNEGLVTVRRTYAGLG